MNDAIFKANNTSGFPQKLNKSVCGGEVFCKTGFRHNFV